MDTSAKPDSERVHLTPPAARAAMCELIARLGYTLREQGLIADHLLDAALCGYEYSGLPKLLELAHAPKAKLPRKPAEIVHETPVSAMIDGGHTVGMITVDDAAELAIAKARDHGFAMVGVFNSWMSGRSAYFVERIARAGLVGMHTVASYAIVAPPGAAKPAIGTNPVAFGFPTLAEPLVIDLGTSAYMMTELALVERRGGKLPEGVAIDADGRPTVDPAEARRGAILHFAGYRGFAIGLAVQALGVMAGAWRSPMKDCAYLIVAMRPDLLTPLETYRRELSETIQRIKAAPRLPGVEEIRIPSERAFKERARRREAGLEIDRRIWNALQAIPDEYRS